MQVATSHSEPDARLPPALQSRLHQRFHPARRVFLVLAMGALVLAAWFAPMDAPAMQRVDAGLKRALVSFATARILNAAISVAQGTEAVVHPFGFGVTLAPGQVLDPVNDLVEHFSNLMLLASVVFGAQKVLMNIGAFWAVSATLSVLALLWAWRSFATGHAPAWLSRALVLCLMVRFAIPLVTLGTDVLWQKFLETDYQASQQVMGTASGRVDQLNPPIALNSDNSGMLDKMKAWIAKNADVKKHFDDLKQAAEQATEHIIKLIVIFVLQTLVFPLLLLWGLYSMAKRLLERTWP